MDDQLQETPNYWNSVFIGALVVAISTSVVGLVMLYYLAGAEPSMSMMIMSGLLMPITCLVGMFGGFISVRHYAKTYDITFKMGTGALVGLFTGIAAAVISGILGQLWNIVDPALVDNFANNMVSALETMDMPDAQREQTISQMMENIEAQKAVGGIIKGVLINAVVLGVVNAISGMIGAKMFAAPEEE